MSRRTRDSFPTANSLKNSGDLATTPDGVTVVVSQPLGTLVAPVNYQLATSSSAEYQANIVTPLAATTKRLIALGDVPGVTYGTPGVTAPPFLGATLIDTTTGSAFFAVDTAASASSWIAVTGAGAGTSSTI